MLVVERSSRLQYCPRIINSYSMGFLNHVSRLLLFCTGILVMWDRQSANGAQTSDLLFDFSKDPSLVEVSTYLSPSSPLVGSTRDFWPRRIQFKENATAPVFSFNTRFIVSVYLDVPSEQQIGYDSNMNVTGILDGFTFAMLPDKLDASFGGDGGYLGLLNATSNGDPDAHTFAVEFDFVRNLEFSDPGLRYHFGIDINSMNSTASAPLWGPGSSGLGSLVLQVWVDYDSSTQTLNVTIADNNANHGCPLSGDQPPTPVYGVAGFSNLSHKVDLSAVLNEYMYVGFTSSFHKGFSVVNLQAWSLSTNSSGPSAPKATFPCSFRSSSRGLFEVWLILLILTATAVIYAVMYKYYTRWVERRRERRLWRFHINADDLGATGLHKFTYKELVLATKNFDSKQVLGRGGFGSVYKGFLPGNKEFVAVKRVAAESDQGEREFMAEVMIIGKIRHRNLVRLQGWCHERGELLLVYDLMPHGSLDKLLFGPQKAPAPISQSQEVDVESREAVTIEFPWERRFNAVVDVARALVYLHTECEKRIIHRDVKVKAANVMLDAKFNARLGDFGLARSYNHSFLAPASTNVAGTFGYLAPELFHTVKQTEETDVFSYGAFLLEVACGKKPIYHEDGEVLLLVDHVWKMWGDSNILKVADPHLRGMYNVHEVTMVLCLGLLCSHPNPAMRPSMHQVLLILKGDAVLPEVPLSRPIISYGFQRSFPKELSSSRDSSLYHTTYTN